MTMPETVRIPVTPGTVAGYGWRAYAPARLRKKALARAVKALGAMRIYRHLLARATQWRDTTYISTLFRQDAEYVKRTYFLKTRTKAIIASRRKPSRKALDPGSHSPFSIRGLPSPGKWHQFKGALLWHPKAKAGERKGRQAFTDLVEALFYVSRATFDRFKASGLFTQYSQGGLARRGRSRRGTNIFLLERG